MQDTFNHTSPSDLPFQGKNLTESIDILKTLDTISDGFFILDKDWKVLYGNKKAEQITGITREQGIGKLFWDLFPEAKDSIFHKHYLKAFQSQQPTHFEEYFKPLRIWFDMSVYPSTNALSIYARDITEKKQLQEKLIKEKAANDKEVTRAAIIGQEKEREFIGKELHDNINQTLASIKLLLEIAETNETLRLEFISKSKVNIIEVINEIRKLTKGLAAPEEGISFIYSIKELMQPYIRSKTFQLHFSVKGDVERIPYSIKLSLFRILQEGLNNITKHAAAMKVAIILTCDGKVRLIIKDDGAGFDTSIKKEGIGLRNIRSRVEVSNGSVKLISSPGNGCCLRIEIPLKQ